MANLAAHLEQLKPAPIDTVYLRYPESTRLEGAPLLGFEDPPHPWLIDRRTCGQPGWFGLAVSAPGPLAGWSREQLAEWATTLIARARPDWPAPLATVVIREKRATFSATPEAEHHRPPPGRAAPGLWLAGDHTATGLPATLEGAVRSGVQCARQLIREGH
ncbi:MAG: FAD-dependent oxidoreductase [Pseudomonadota bacterium]